MVGSMTRRAAAVAAACTVLMSGAACGSGTEHPAEAIAPAPIARTGMPALRVDTIARGLNRIADVGFLPDGKVLVAEREGRLWVLSSTAPDAAIAPVTADLSDVWVRGDAGLMGLAVHRDFSTTRRFTTCQAHAESGRPTDVRLITWELSADARSAQRIVDPLVGGLPISSTGRNAGCRPVIATDGALLVGTGDSQRADVAQDLASLGGKVLRIDLGTGGPPLGNPFGSEPNPALRLVLTFGHSNVTGIAIDPVSGTAYSVDAATGREDELNKLVSGQNYGWDPSRGGQRTAGYDESTPPTDLTRYPTAIPATWSSGTPAPGVTGAAFVDGPQWGDLDGRIAISTGTGQKLLVLQLRADGTVGEVLTPPQLDTAFGRLTSVRSGPSGDLFVTTGNGTDDKVLRITPT
ncbi:Glucose/arabinose dehydrogenase, beta-propeller fold [Pseudonocardia thermophila]|uniref:Glucose/arabinose dehydrogenase, beta-propeller fold n=1 Tax=Pseudonocardia thermophila TaxID=1848 RepID=A0A1M6RMU8_PSETH|nr:PQQ-dependent sugar dehydrogenase [Pseudonocardia thermophila]SHK33720.1 Glucose/arabinose dehydrogenase, beta-propeller fold [Pseudonocardia thermophila]